MKKIRKFIILLATLVLAITSSVLLLGCNSNIALSFEKAYDYSAIAGVGILKTQVDNQGASPMSARSTSLNDAQKEQIINAMAISQNLDGQSFVKTAVTQSDRPEYEFSYTITTNDYAGNQATYQFYYTQTDISDAEDEAENEKEYRLDGLVIFDGVEYQMIGNSEVEQGETEFAFTITLNNNNYVVIEQETETNETEFNYTVFKDGQQVFATEIEYEVGRNGNVEFEFELYDAQNDVYKDYEYEFYENGGERFARVIIKDNGNTVFATLKITETPNGFQYEFINA